MDDLKDPSSKEFRLCSVYLSIYLRIGLKYNISVVFDCLKTSSSDILNFYENFLGSFCKHQSLNEDQVKQGLYFFNLPISIKQGRLH